MIKAILLFTFSVLFFTSYSQTISAEASKDYVGKTVTVSGKVVDGRYLVSSGRQPTLLNIDKPFPNQIFSIVIYGDDRKTFGYKPEEVLLHKNILVTGKVELYKGKPQINVKSPDQIVISTPGTEATAGNNPNGLASGELKLASSVKLRSGPGTGYKTIEKLKSGTIVKLLHTDNGWSYISVKRTLGKDEKDYALVGFIKTEELNQK